MLSKENISKLNYYQSIGSVDIVVLYARGAKYLWYMTSL